MKPLAGGRLENVHIAFKYLLQFPDILPLVGIQAKWEAEEIIDILHGPTAMTQDEQQEMERIRNELGTRFCRSCLYCQPCPQGISIPWVLQVRSSSKRFPSDRIYTGQMVQVTEKVAECDECGECESKCPYSLQIMAMIKEEADWFWNERRKYIEQCAK